MPLKRERMSYDQLSRSVSQKRIQQERFREVSRNKQMQRISLAARQGHLTSRQRAFLARKNQMIKARREEEAKNASARITVDNYFDRVFILNMTRQLDKWYNMENRMKRLGISNYERFAAIDGYSEPYVSQWTAYSKKPWNKFDKKYGRKAIRSPGVWGILKSMKKMFLVAKKRGYRNFLVLQDDAMFHHDFLNLFDQKVRRIPPWKMLYLGVTQYSYARNMLSAKDYYNPMGLADGAFAVAFDASIYDFVIRQINHMIMPFDSGPLMTVQRAFMRECVVIRPFLIIADVRSSSCRSGRDQEKFSKSVRWDYPRFKEWTSIPPAALVSVIIVTENSERYVEDAVYSILHQTYKNVELIIFDNASEDDTLHVLRSIEKRQKSKKQIQIYPSYIKLPTSVYKNMGMMISKGYAVTFQDPDCKSISNRLETQMILLRRNNGVVTVGYKEDENGSTVSSFRSMMVSKKIIDEIGFMENCEEGAEYEYYQKIRHCNMPISDVKEVFYIPYASLAENRDDSEEVSPERKSEIDKYHNWLDTRNGPKYRAFPPKNFEAIDDIIKILA